MSSCVRTWRAVSRAVAIAGVCAASFLIVSADPAEARKRQRGGYAPPYADIVVDVNSGRVLRATHPDAHRHPASVTKVMTLYLLFEQLERGRFRLDTPLRVSSYAASRAPSKIGFDAGETIEVEDAIKALVTKSANDVASVVAEAIGGDEETFAEMMTRKARQLGMSRTTFKNASGLPHPEQVTTARDLTLLGRAIHDRFPKYWRYFQTRSFEYAGTTYRNHNRLLGRVDGVDGIKTGFTRASGFNLLTSARLGNQHIMAVVLGGRSGRARDAQMANLVEEQLPRAYAGLRTAPMVAEAQGDEPIRQVAAPARPTERNVERVASADVPAPRPRPAVVAELARPDTANVRAVAASAGGTTAARPAPTLATVTPGMRWVVGPQPNLEARDRSALQARGQNTQVLAFTSTINGQKADTDPELAPLPPKPVASAVRAAPVLAVKVEPARQDAARAAAQRSGWVIQLAATDDEGKARAILNSAKSRNGNVLASAEAFTEKVVKGDATLFRARFAGFDGDDAQSACKALKKTGFNCFAQRI
jgi:D-alanyl-D-alanine carboxypeptidase